MLFVVVAGTVVLGNLFPRKVSFLPGMRYYAGNWDTTLWCIKPSAEEKIDAGIVAIASMPAAQMETVLRQHGDRARCTSIWDTRSARFNTHGRAHVHPRAPRDGRAATRPTTSLTDGERICSTAIGWNFGDGHMHNEQLIAATAGAVPTSNPARCASSCSTRSRFTSSGRSTGSSTPPPVSSSAATCKSPTW